MALRRGQATPTEEELARCVAYFRVPRETLLNVSFPQESSNVEPMRSSLGGGRSIPILGRVPAGVPVEAVQEVVGFVDVDFPDPSEYFGLIVKGDSMYPEYLEGDTVIIRIHPQMEIQIL